MGVTQDFGLVDNPQNIHTASGVPTMCDDPSEAAPAFDMPSLTPGQVKQIKFWEDRVKERPSMMKFPDNLPIQGGVPIMYQGECVGAIGVSGVQSHEDEQVANAGVAALG